VVIYITSTYTDAAQSILIKSESLWRWCIVKTTNVLGIIHPPSLIKHDVSESGVCLHLQASVVGTNSITCAQQGKFYLMMETDFCLRNVVLIKVGRYIMSRMVVLLSKHLTFSTKFRSNSYCLALSWRCFKQEWIGKRVFQWNARVRQMNSLFFCLHNWR
jgi:hypothetical protein